MGNDTGVRLIIGDIAVCDLYVLTISLSCYHYVLQHLQTIKWVALSILFSSFGT